jgi:hypothetical protein
VVDEKKFWELIDRSREAGGGDVWQQAALLTTWLAEIDPQEILSFQRHFNVQTRKAYRADLWDAAVIVNEGGSDDGFADFLGWLVAQGKEVCDAVLANPDTLGDVFHARVEPGGTADCEDMLFAASRAYQRRMQGQEMPEDPRDTEPLRLQGSRLTPEEMKQRFPKLCRRYHGEDPEDPRI